MNKRFLRLKLSGKGYAVDQRVGHFPERGLNGLLIIRHSYLLVGFGNTQVGDVPPTLEDRQADLRQESQMPVPPSKRWDSSFEAVPMFAVNEMRGKKFARAAPMSALAALSVCSA